MWRHCYVADGKEARDGICVSGPAPAATTLFLSTAPGLPQHPTISARKATAWGRLPVTLQGISTLAVRPISTG